MTTRRRSLPTILTFPLVILLVLLCLYGGTYLLLLEGKLYWQTGVDTTTGQNLFAISPKYRMREPWIERGLAPAHWLDRRMRADHWLTIEHSSGMKWKNPEGHRLSPTPP
jgi:hypothetical protein